MKRKPARKPTKKRRPLPNGIPDRLRSKMRDNVAQAVCLLIGRPEFVQVLELLQEVGKTLSAAEQKRFAESVRQRIKLLEQRRENCELLAPEGRAAKKPDDEARADRVCKLYRRIRPSHPSGKRGNGAAVADVARQIGPLFDRKKPITVQAVRKILKRRGVPCR